MSTSLRPRLVNGRFGDPALFVEFSHEREAVLIDCGDLSVLSARDLLRIGTVAVSHMHMDHLFGFDALLRVNVGREARIDLFGPEGFADRLGHKLQGYTWDLVHRYENELVLRVAELIAPKRLRHFRCRPANAFAAEDLGEADAPGGPVCETPRWRLTARPRQQRARDQDRLCHRPARHARQSRSAGAALQRGARVLHRGLVRRRGRGTGPRPRPPHHHRRRRDRPRRRRTQGRAVPLLPPL